MIYPNSNLPTVSQSWGRAIQKGLEALEATVTSNEINNKARDAQLQAAYVLTNKNIQDIKFALTSSGIAVTGVNEIKNAIYVPGTTKIDGNSIQTGTFSASKITSGTIDAATVEVKNLNASEIKTGTLTGLTVQTAASGSRVVMSGSSNNLQFYYGSTYSGSLYGGASGLLLSGSGGALSIDSSGTSIDGGSNSIDVLSAGIVISGTTSLMNTTYCYGTFNPSGISNTGGISSTGTISTGGGLQRTVYSGGGTTTASVDNNGTFIRTSSSARYKCDIQDVSYDYDAVLALQPKSFRLKNEAETNPDSIVYPGFVAEEMAGTALDIFVAYENLPDGTKRPDGVRYAELTSALVSAIKHQHSVIESLTTRIEALESKV